MVQMKNSMRRFQRGEADIRRPQKEKRKCHLLYIISTLLVFTIGISLRLFSGPFLFPIPNIAAWLIGSILLLIGLTIFGWWHHFRHKIYEGKLVTEGVYRYIRHPHYSSIIVGMFGVSFLFQSMIFLLFSFFTVSGLNQHAKEEEEHLIKTYGDLYKKYMKRVRWRFIPRVI